MQGAVRVRAGRLGHAEPRRLGGHARETWCSTARARWSIAAHSLGCIATTHLSEAAAARIQGALLVAPADPERRAVLSDFAPVPYAKAALPQHAGGQQQRPFLPGAPGRRLCPRLGQRICSPAECRAHQHRIGTRRLAPGPGAAPIADRTSRPRLDWPARNLHPLRTLGNAYDFQNQDRSSARWCSPPADRRIGPDAAQRLVRRGARVLQGLQRRLHRQLQKDHRQGGQDRPVAWRARAPRRAPWPTASTPTW